MRVNLAAQVLKAFGPLEAVATAQLCEKVDKAFHCLTVRSTKEHQRKQNVTEAGSGVVI